MHAGVAAQYQWSCSSLDTANNRYLLPDLDIGDDSDVARSALISSDTSTSVDYIFPVPSALNCSGTVSAIRFCYTGDSIGTEQSVFTLLTLQQNNLDFTITDVIPVRSTPTTEICTVGFLLFVGTVQYCCDTLSLDMMDRFSLPAPNFAFGVLPEDSSLLTYHPSISANSVFLVEHFRFPNTVIGTATSGSTFSLRRVSDKQTEHLDYSNST